MSDETGDADRVGSVAEEAAKLLGALQGWAREGVSDSAGATGTTASSVSGLLHDLDEHLATGGEDCRYCPVCQVISAVRATSPEVKQHLATAATSLLHAATGVLEAHAQSRPGSDGQPGRGGRARRDQGPVEKIDLSDDAEPEWED